MRPARALLMFAVFTGVFLAGCTDEPAPPAPEPEPLPALATYAGCPWNYFDGSVVDCERLPLELTVEPELPAGWMCMGEDQREGWSFHWNPVTDERGIHFNVELNESEASDGVDAVLRFKTNNEITLYNWSDSPLSGFVRVPTTYGDNVTFRFLMYHIGYAWNGTGLADASADELWSLHDDQFWVVHKVTTGNTTYTFQDMNSRNTTKRTEEGDIKVSFHEPQTFFVRGSDFHFSAVYDSLFIGRALQGIQTLKEPDRQCQISSVRAPGDAQPALPATPDVKA